MTSCVGMPGGEHRFDRPACSGTKALLVLAPDPLDERAPLLTTVSRHGSRGVGVR